MSTLIAVPKKILLIAVFVYALSSLLTYGVLASFLGSGTPSLVSQPSDSDTTPLGSLLEIDPSEPKDQVCPLNGALFTATERNAWEQRRPLAVMIENAPDARPQSGLTRADIVFEAVAEGGVTRFMPIYYCDAQRDEVPLAPVRSARIYFMELAASFNWPLYVHVGGANVPGPSDALGILGDWGWVGENDLNQFSIGFPTFVRDYNRLPGKDVATEHTMVSSTELLWSYAEENRGWTNLAPDYPISRSLEPGSDWLAGFEPWSYGESQVVGDVSQISYEFWTGYEQYAVSWSYDSGTNSYRRSMAGEPHLNLEDDEQISVSNVIVFLTDETGPINEKMHMLYDIVGRGEALVFNNGSVSEVNWSKASEFSPIVFTDDRGDNYQFTPGKFWISVVDVSTDVSY